MLLKKEGSQSSSDVLPKEYERFNKNENMFILVTASDFNAIIAHQCVGKVVGAYGEITIKVN